MSEHPKDKADGAKSKPIDDQARAKDEVSEADLEKVSGGANPLPPRRPVM